MNISDIQIGKKFRLKFGGSYKHPMDKLIHIRAIVDDEYFVFRWYGKHKQWGHYQVEWKYTFEYYIKNGIMKEVK